MVRAVVDLGASLGLTTVAEGIEQARRVPALQSLGRAAGRGFLFAKPMPADVVAALAHDAALRAPV